MRDDDGDTPEPPDRETTEGRGEGNGRWLEEELEDALNRWDYGTWTRCRVLNMEIDVIANSGDPDGRPCDQLVAQAKDYESRAVQPRMIHRLCMLAYAFRGMPVLCTTGRLTKNAWRTARMWDVRVLDYEDLQGDELPEPDRHVAPPSATDPLARNRLDEVRDMWNKGGFMVIGHTDHTSSFDRETGSPRYVPGYDNHGWWFENASLF